MTMNINEVLKMSARSDVTAGPIWQKCGTNVGNTVPQKELVLVSAERGPSSKIRGTKVTIP